LKSIVNHIEVVKIARADYKVEIDICMVTAQTLQKHNTNPLK